MIANKLVKIATGDLVTPPGFEGLDQEEIIGGMDIASGYLSQYPKLIKAQGDRFQIIDTASQEIIEELTTLDYAAVFYAHLVYRLHRGTVTGNPISETWNDQEKEIVAMSYDNPLGKEHSSRGNFDALGYSDWLDSKEKRKLISKRVYAFLSLPRKYKGEVLAATFGITAMKSLSGVIKLLRMVNLGLPMAFLRISLKQDNNAQGRHFHRVVFDILVNEHNQPLTTCQNADQYRIRVKPIAIR